MGAWAYYEVQKQRLHEGGGPELEVCAGLRIGATQSGGGEEMHALT